MPIHAVWSPDRLTTAPERTSLRPGFEVESSSSCGWCRVLCGSGDTGDKEGHSWRSCQFSMDRLLSGAAEQPEALDQILLVLESYVNRGQAGMVATCSDTFCVCLDKDVFRLSLQNREALGRRYLNPQPEPGTPRRREFPFLFRFSRTKTSHDLGCLHPSPLATSAFGAPQGHKQKP